MTSAELKRFDENIKRLLNKKEKKSILDKYQEKFNVNLVKCSSNNKIALCYFSDGSIINIKNVYKRYYKTMNIKLLRDVFTSTTTLGRMFVNDKFFAYTLEDTVRDLGKDGKGKVQNKTAIPAGKYTVAVTMSNRFKRELPELKDVPFFKGVRIHGGNTSENTEGCLLIGENTDHKSKIWNCKGKVNEITSLIKQNGTATIEIVNSKPLIA